MDKNSKAYKDWLQKAENDLKAAKGIYGYYEKPPTDTICYHCHQVAEKSLKAYLFFKGKKFQKIHDLIALLNICLASDKSLDSLREDVEVLNQYYIETKYPLDMFVEYSKDEAKKAIDRAGSVFKTIINKIEPLRRQKD